MNDLIKKAIEKYEAHEAACEAEQKAHQQADQETGEKERGELRQFLATLMPEELVQYAELEDFRERDANRFNYANDRRGTAIRISVPSCFPVLIRVYGSGGKYQMAREPYQYDSVPRFGVPTRAEVKADEYGDDGYYIWFDGREDFDDFMTALGYAAVRGVELIPLQEEIEQRKADDKINDEYVCEAEAGWRKIEEERTPQERIAHALEDIASSLTAMVQFKADYGI